MGEKEYVSGRGVHYVVDIERCNGCGLCVAYCPRTNTDEKAIVMTKIPNTNRRGYIHIDVKDIERCSACGICALFCGDGAIREITLDED